MRFTLSWSGSSLSLEERPSEDPESSLLTLAAMISVMDLIGKINSNHYQSRICWAHTCSCYHQVQVSFPLLHLDLTQRMDSSIDYLAAKY